MSIEIQIEYTKDRINNMVKGSFRMYSMMVMVLTARITGLVT